MCVVYVIVCLVCACVCVCTCVHLCLCAVGRMRACIFAVGRSRIRRCVFVIYGCLVVYVCVSVSLLTQLLVSAVE